MHDRSEQLDALVEQAGRHASEGYRVEDEFVAWIVNGRRTVVLAEQDGRAWLLAEVGIDGRGVYPEDDLADDAGVELPPGVTLLWNDNAERAILAKDLGEDLDATTLADAFASFETLAAGVERQLVSNEDLGIAPSPSEVHLLDRGLLVPPSP